MENKFCLHTEKVGDCSVLDEKKTNEDVVNLENTSDIAESDLESNHCDRENGLAEVRTRLRSGGGMWRTPSKK